MWLRFAIQQTQHSQTSLWETPVELVRVIVDATIPWWYHAETQSNQMGVNCINVSNFVVVQLNFQELLFQY